MYSICQLFCPLILRALKSVVLSPRICSFRTPTPLCSRPGLPIFWGGSISGPAHRPRPSDPRPLPSSQSTGNSRWQCGAAVRDSPARMTADWTFTGFWPSSSCSSVPRTAATRNSTSPRERSTPQVGGGGAAGPGAEPHLGRAAGGGRKQEEGKLRKDWGRGHALGAGLEAELRVRRGAETWT